MKPRDILLKTLTAACGLGLFGASSEAQSAPVIGIYYSTMHCTDSADTGLPIYDISKILAGIGTWGPEFKTHWWGRPDQGYYCLSRDDVTLKKHAEQLRDAGIDFVYLDITNHPDLNSDINAQGLHTRSSAPEEMIKKPLDRMLAVWSTVTNAPKIVPWVQVVEDTPTVFPYKGDMIDHIRMKMTGSSLAYPVNNKPVVLVSPRDGVYANNKIASLAPTLTVFRMWVGAQGDWSFMSHCSNDSDFKSKRGNVDCGQQASSDGNQIAVSAAYQSNWMSNTASAIPKFHGMTFLRQMETAWRSGRQVVTINGWNEWTSMRLKVNAPGIYVSDYAFTDQYDKEYSRDLEPGGGAGDQYYQLMKRAIAELDAGRNPMNAGGSFGTIRGVIDGVVNNSVNGWACSYGSSLSVDVHLYVGGSAGSGTVIGGYGSDNVSEIQVAQACGSIGKAYRFSIPLSTATRRAHAGKKIYIHGIHPTGAYSNALISNSGVFAVPAP
ncbi:MAG: hypothetical protein E6Q88_08895 [Lysobacteraceae bacterium]|nr:MAG: hypothetical protein E6Q88_08895 [Xanthomonadaceae bacterium]